MAAPNTILPKVAKTASWVEARIHKVLRENREETHREKSHRLAFSQIGKCERALQAGIRGVASEREPEGRFLVLFDLGDAVETHLIELLRKGGFVINNEEKRQQIRVTAFDERASGRLDGEIQLNRRSHPDEIWSLLEIKSVKENTNPKRVTPSSYEALEAAGSYAEWNPVYAAQVQVYMGLRGRKSALVVVECKNDSRLWTEIIDFDPDEFIRLMDKAERIVTSPETLDRPAEAKSQYCAFCKYCDVQNWCWGPLAGISFDE